MHIIFIIRKLLKLLLLVLRKGPNKLIKSIVFTVVETFIESLQGPDSLKVSGLIDKTQATQYRAGGFRWGSLNAQRTPRGPAHRLANIWGSLGFTTNNDSNEL